MWADPKNLDRPMISDDGGAIISLNRGQTWKRITLDIVISPEIKSRKSHG